MTNTGKDIPLKMTVKQDIPPVSGVEQIQRMAEVHKFSRDDLDRLKIIYPGMQKASVLNAFRELRTQLLQKAQGKNFVCLVSSICAGGGNSFVAMNLAACFALDRAKTSMIIDCNLYDAFVESLIISDAEVGLTDYLESSQVKVEDVVYATGMPRVRAIPVGTNREAGAEYFSSGKMKAFIAAVRERYSDRFIFVDAPPAYGSAETRILADICDMVLLVVPYGKAYKAQIQESIDSVGRHKLAGLVFNN